MQLSKEDFDRFMSQIGEVIRKFEPTPPAGTILFQESIEGARGTQIWDSTLALWEITDGICLRDRVDTGGRGSELAYHNHEVYALGTDANWWVYRDNWLRATEDPIVVPIPHIDTETCVNLAPFGHFGSCRPFINMLQQSHPGWLGGSTGGWTTEWSDPRSNWITGMPPGASLQCIVQVNDFAGEHNYTFLNPGQHIVVWDGPLDLTVTGTDVANGRLLAPNRYAFDVLPTESGFGNPSINLLVTNNTKKPQSLTGTITAQGVVRPAMYNVDDEADYLAGKTFQRSFIDTLCGAKHVRFMDWLNVPVAGIKADGSYVSETLDVDNFYLETARTFAIDDTEHRYLMPPEVMGKLCKEANCGAFITVPAMLNEAGTSYLAAAFKVGAGPAWHGRVRVEKNDESWNSEYPWVLQAKYLKDKVAPFITVVDNEGKPSTADIDKIGCATAHEALKAWLIFNVYFDQSQLIRVLGGQAAWLDGMGGQLEYVDPITGKRAGEMMDEYAVAPYWGAGLPTDDLSSARVMAENLWEVNTLKWWVDRCEASIDYNATLLHKTQQYLYKRFPQARLTCYEGGGAPQMDANMPRQGPKDPADYARWQDAEIGAQDFQDGTGGAEVLEYYWTTFINGNFTLMNWFYSHGYTPGLQYGLCKSQYMAPTERMKLFRTL